MTTIFKTLIVVSVLAFQATAYSDDVYSYIAKIRCGKNSSITYNEYFVAKNDTEANDEVTKNILKSAKYRGKDCKLAELVSDRPQSQSSSGRSHLK
jgi:hypothetical protein